MSTENQKPPADQTEAAVPIAYKETKALFTDYPADAYNRLLPTLTVADSAGQFQKPKIEIIKIDPTLPVTGDYGKVVKPGSGEVYQDRRFPKGSVALTSVGLAKFQHAGGLIFPPQLQKITWNSTSAFAQASGAMKKGDGSLLILTASKLIDLELEELKFRSQAETRNDYRVKDGKNPWTEAEIEAQVRRDLLQARENMVTNAETKAQNRVIRKAFALKSSYTTEELRKPFVMIRFDQVFDLNDPKQAQLLLEQARTASGNLFPVREAAAAEVREASVQTVHVDNVPEAEAVPVDDLDEPIPPDRTTVENEGILEQMVASGFEEIKKAYRTSLEELTEPDTGEREQMLRSWREILAGDGSNEAKRDPERLKAWGNLALEAEVAVAALKGRE